jgi:hypothetical protein
MVLAQRVILPAFVGGVLLFGGCGGETSGGSGSGAMAGTAGGQNGGSGGAGNGGAAGNGGSGGSVGNAGNGGSAGVSGSGSGGVSGGAAGSGGSGGIPPEWFACADTSECTIAEAQCCQFCGPEKASDAIAFNSKYGESVATALCHGTPMPCPAVDCLLRPAYVLPFCIEGRCQAIDIREDKLTSCSTEAECTLRWGTQCCEACTQDIGLLVAVNAQVDYMSTVCGNQAACPRCAIAEYPSNARALCGSDNHCKVGFLR